MDLYSIHKIIFLFFPQLLKTVLFFVVKFFYSVLIPKTYSTEVLCISWNQWATLHIRKKTWKNKLKNRPLFQNLKQPWFYCPGKSSKVSHLKGFGQRRSRSGIKSLFRSVKANGNYMGIIIEWKLLRLDAICAISNDLFRKGPLQSKLLPI